MTFNGCKLKKDEWCTGSTSITYPSTFGGGTETESFVFKVTGDGTTMETKEHADSTDVSTMTIVSLTKTDAEFTMTEDGSTTTIKATKN